MTRRTIIGAVLARLVGPLLAFIACAAPPCAVAQEASGPAPVVVGTKEAPPFVIKNDDGSWRGISIELWQRIAGELDLDYELRETTLAEMFDGLEDGAFDVGVGALTVTAERVERVDFTHPFHTSGLGIAVRAEPGSGRWLAAVGRFLSFDFFKVVAALVLVLLAAGLVVWILERRANAEQFGGTPMRGLGAGFWWSAVTMTTVGYGDKAPVTAGGRLVAIVWMFAGVITISSFTAAIASSLTVDRLAGRIKGPADLPGSRVATIAGSTSEAYLRRNQITFRRYETVPDGLAAVAAGDVEAMVYDAPILRYLVNKDPDATVVVLPTTFERQDYAIGLPPDSSLRKPINEIMLRTLTEPAWEQTLFTYLGR